MFKTLRLSVSLKNTYRVNSILYSIKQIPLVKRLLPDSLYSVRGLKIFACVISLIIAFFSIFIGKALYLGLMVAGAGEIFETLPADARFLHIFFFLTLIGGIMNTSMFDPSRDKFYAIVLMRMNAKAYTVTNYLAFLLKMIVGFVPFCLLFGLPAGLPVAVCLLLPLFVVTVKLIFVVRALYLFEKREQVTNENSPQKHKWIAAGVLLLLAYGLPALGVLVPVPVLYALGAAAALGAALSVRKILRFDRYREMYGALLTQTAMMMQNTQGLAKQMVEKKISADVSVTSQKTGFAFLNELFVLRHRRILWKSALRMTAICAGVVLLLVAATLLRPEMAETVNEMVMTFLPYFVFILYAINRGTGYTQALFMNCDHSLLTYSFFKQPRLILQLFRIRLFEIVKVNLPPAAVIGAGLSALLYVSGGTAEPLYYALIPLAMLALSAFFSVHYLTIYYLLQPYNAGTEMKSGMYKIVMSVTYFVCFMFMRLRLPTPVFALGALVFCVLYCVAACVLVYRLAPKTFRLRL